MILIVEIFSTIMFFVIHVQLSKIVATFSMGETPLLVKCHSIFSLEKYDLLLRKTDLSLISQDAVICSPAQRECIEQRIGLSFNCSVSCEGMYADVEWVEDMVGEGKEKEQLLFSLMGKIERKQQEENKKKIQRLIDNYNMFKTRSVQHFRFNASLNLSSFGKGYF